MYRVLLGAVVSAALVVTAPGAARADDIISISGGGTTVVDDVIDLAWQTAKAATCVPRSTSTTVYDPKAYVYYGAVETIYVWEVLAEAAVTGCPDNVVTVKAQLMDQALNGTSLPATGDQKTASGKARAGVVADLVQRYSNVVMATGLSYHQLTVSVTASQTDGTTTTAWCAEKSWTYLATVGGPVMVGSTPTEKVKCGA